MSIALVRWNNPTDPTYPTYIADGYWDTRKDKRI